MPSSLVPLIAPRLTAQIAALAEEGDRAETLRQGQSFGEALAILDGRMVDSSAEASDETSTVAPRSKSKVHAEAQDDALQMATAMLLLAPTEAPLALPTVFTPQWRPVTSDEQGLVNVTGAGSGPSLSAEVALSVLPSADLPPMPDAPAPLPDMPFVSFAPTDASQSFLPAMAGMNGMTATPGLVGGEVPPRVAPTFLTVAPAIDSENWGGALGQQLIGISASGEHVAELRINPAGLGPITVTLTVNDSQAQVQFVAAHAAVRQAIESALPQLRTTFADNGISLGQAFVSAESRQPRQQDFGDGQARSGRTRSSYLDARRMGAMALAGAAAEEVLRPLPMQGAAVDTFA